jgi:hypothetical protein
MSEAPKPATETDSTGRRASDAMALRFKPEALAPSPAPADEAPPEAEMETIDLDVPLPGDAHDDLGSESGQAERAPAQLSTGQRQHRLLLAKFMKSFADYAARDELTRIDIGDLKRGDVVVIRTVVGSIYLSVLDRINARRGQAGQILCQCRYDLGDQCTLVHSASIALPICSNRHVIVGPDGGRRNASRRLRLESAATLPPQVDNLLNEHFFTSLAIYAHPNPERLRPIDVWRRIAPVFVVTGRGVRWLFGALWRVIQENNRREREKKARRDEAERQRLAAKLAAREAKRAAREAAKRNP